MATIYIFIGAMEIILIEILENTEIIEKKTGKQWKDM